MIMFLQSWSICCFLVHVDGGKKCKKVARISNFKNVAYSVSKQHQRLMCAHLQGNFFSFEELQCGPCMLANDNVNYENTLHFR